MTAAPPLIRELTRADLAQVQTIFSEFVACHEQCDHIFDRIAAAGVMWSENAYRLHTQPGDTCRVFVAELDGEVVGYCLARIVEKPPVYQVKLIGEIGNIGVKEEHKRQGIGAALFARAKEWFAEKGVHHIEVEVATANPQAVGFWTKMGGREFIKRIEIGV